MTMIFERIYTTGIAQLSYLVGDSSEHVAAVIDPRPNVDLYLSLARSYGVSITHVFETHIHADFLSGSRALTTRLGLRRPFVSGEGDARYGYDVERVMDGSEFDFGSVRLTARHTPGHTPEHLAYEIAHPEDASNPWGVFTGDSLFVGSAGRPDLLGDEMADALTEQLFHTLRRYYLQLDDATIIYPCHGAGSACGADIGDKPMGTIGRERRDNPFVKYATFNEFARFIKNNAPPEPSHYRHLKQVNGEGPPAEGQRPVVPALTASQFRVALDSDRCQPVDTRQMLAFGGGHVPGAINLGSRPEMSVWAGQVLNYDRPLLLVVEGETNLDWVVDNLLHTGFIDYAGYLAGGMRAWDNSGYPLWKVPQMSVHELREKKAELQILDVRSESEWEAGRIPGASHWYVADMKDQVDGGGQLDPSRPVVTYCDSGYRDEIAASLLQRAGFRDVRNVPGSWQAWKNAGYEIAQ